MLFRKNFGIVLLSLMPVIILIGAFFVDTVIGHEVYICNGRISPTGNATPGVSDYCSQVYLTVNYTNENAYFYDLERAVRDADENIMFDDNGNVILETVLGWFRDQDWLFSDDVSCEAVLDTPLGRTWSSGWWEGIESKGVVWVDEEQIEIVEVDSHTKSYEALALEDEDGNPLYCVCPTYRQDLEAFHTCGIPGLVATGDDWSEYVIHPDGEPLDRRGAISGEPFSCFAYPGYPDANCSPAGE